MQTDSLRRKRIQRRVEGRGSAPRTGLRNQCAAHLRQTICTESSVEMFEKTGVMTRKELEARNEVKWETYTKKITDRGSRIGRSGHQPYCTGGHAQYQSDAARQCVQDRVQLFDSRRAQELWWQRIWRLIEEISKHTACYQGACGQHDRSAQGWPTRLTSEREKAIAYHDTVVPALDAIRYHIDKLELMVDNEMWALPKLSGTAVHPIRQT